MTLTATETECLPPGIVALRRSTPRLMAALIRNQLGSLPDACFTERMVVTRNFGHRRVYVVDPELVQEALVRSAERMEKTRPSKEALAPALGDGILTSDGPTWRWQRRTLAPAFQPERLEALLPKMIACAEATRARWLALPPDSTIDLGHEMMRTTLDVLVKTMFADTTRVDAARLEEGIADLLRAVPWWFVRSLLRAPAWMPFPGKRRGLAAARFMRDSVRADVDARRGAGGGSDDLIGMLLAAVEPETGRAMSDAEITDNILTFLLAGHETTAIAMGWIFALLSDHPEVTARLAAEIDAVTGGAAIRSEHIASLVYARQVVSEAMRLYPPASIIARAVVADTELGGVALPRGSAIIVPIWAVHRHASLWSQPEAFDPDRFEPAAAKTRHRYAFMPFGAGPRICIGSSFATMEATAILAVLIQTVGLERIGPMPAPQMRLTLRPETPLRMRVRRR